MIASEPTPEVLKASLRANIDPKVLFQLRVDGETTNAKGWAI